MSEIEKEYSEEDYENDLAISQYVFRKKFRKHEEYKEDLVQSSLIALWKRRNDYNEEKGMTLASYKFMISEYAMLTFLSRQTAIKAKDLEENHIVSIYEPIPGTDGETYVDILEDENCNIELDFDVNFLRNVYHESVDTFKLSKNNVLFKKIANLILKGHYDLEIAKKLGCSRERCRQVRKKIARVFREKLIENEYFDMAGNKEVCSG